MSQFTHLKAVYILDCLSVEDYLYKNCGKYLSSEEVDYSHMAKAKIRQLEFLGSRILLRKILANLYDIQPTDFKFAKNAMGKPYLIGIESPIFFNISHSRYHVAIGINADSDIGIDIEFSESEKSKEWFDMAKRFFHPSEAEYLSRIHKDNVQDHFYKMWTIKESIAKLFSADLGTVLKTYNSLVVEQDRETVGQFDGKDFYIQQQIVTESIEFNTSRPSKRLLAFSSHVPINHLRVIENNMTIGEHGFY